MAPGSPTFSHNKGEPIERVLRSRYKQIKNEKSPESQRQTGVYKAAGKECKNGAHNAARSRS